MDALFPDGTECRFAAAELRSGAGRTLSGYAAVWDTPAKIGGAFQETVRRGAFSASLAAGGDVIATYQHDPAALLGRTASGTLALREDARGLLFECQLPDTQLGRDVHTMCQRGDITGASFTFACPAGGDHWTARDARELRQVQLIEVACVTTPAYAAATVSSRALAHVRGHALGTADTAYRFRALRLLEL